MGSGPSVHSIGRRGVRTARRHWKTLLLVALAIFGSLAVLDVLAQRVFGFDEIAALDDVSTARLLTSLGAVFSVTVTVLLGNIFFAGVVAAAIEETRGGRSPRVRRLLRTTPFLTLLAIDLLFLLGLTASLLLLLVPGFFFFGYFILAAPVAEIEHLGVRAAFRRSREITRGHLLLVVLILAPIAIGGDWLGRLVSDATAGLVGEGVFAEWFGITVGGVAGSLVLALATVSITYELLESGRNEARAGAPAD